MKRIVINAKPSSPEFEAIKACFSEIALPEVFENNKHTAVPFSFDAFLPAVKGNIVQAKEYWKTKDSNEDVLFSSILIGFFKEDGSWYITVVIGIEYKEKTYTSFGKSLQLQGITDKIIHFPETTRNKEFEKVIPGFTEKDAIEAISNSKQKTLDWLKEAVRGCRDLIQF
jgi:hypothetical protein